MVNNSQPNKPAIPIKVSPDKMLAYIPENTKLSPKISSWSYEDFCNYLANFHLAIKPKIEIYNELIKICSTEEPYIDEKYILIKGRPFMPARDAIIKWLNAPHIPHDLVEPSAPFAILYQARGPVPAKDVYGATIPLTPEQEKQQPGTMLVLHSKLSVNQKGEVTSEQAGQVILKPNFLDFSDTYFIQDVRPEIFHKFNFPCHVHVICDLEGPLQWIVQGNLSVEGFWSAHKIKVMGNASTKSGIQTNFINDEENSIIVKGTLDASFIQNSTLIVEGNVKIEKAITNSRLIINSGHLECRGDPGRIIACSIQLKVGSVFANSVGGEKDKSAHIRFLTEEGANNSKIDAVAESTRMQIKKSNIIVKFTQPWPPKR